MSEITHPTIQGMSMQCITSTYITYPAITVIPLLLILAIEDLYS
jgi:hypothetical protein